jgi:hypothetical protein
MKCWITLSKTKLFMCFTFFTQRKCPYPSSRFTNDPNIRLVYCEICNRRKHQLKKVLTKDGNWGEGQISVPWYVYPYLPTERFAKLLMRSWYVVTFRSSDYPSHRTPRLSYNEQPLRGNILNIHGICVKWHFCRISTKTGTLQQIFLKIPDTKFYENPSGLTLSNSHFSQLPCEGA